MLFCLLWAKTFVSTFQFSDGLHLLTFYILNEGKTEIKHSLSLYLTSCFIAAAISFYEVKTLIFRNKNNSEHILKLLISQFLEKKTFLTFCT